MDGKRPVHLLDATRPQRRGIVFGVCGARVRGQYATTMGWKVTCDQCNPPTRRRVRVKPRAPAPQDLETA